MDTRGQKRAKRNLAEMLSRIMLDGFVIERKVTIGPGSGIVYLPNVLAGKTIRIAFLHIKEMFLTKDTLNTKLKKDLESTAVDIITNGTIYIKKVSVLGGGPSAGVFVPNEWIGKFVRVIVIPVDDASFAKDRQIAELKIKLGRAQKQVTEARNKLDLLESEKPKELPEKTEPVIETEKNLEDEDSY